MALLNRLHPLLIHFPIGLVIAAALAELMTTITAGKGWRIVAIGSLRTGAVFAALAAIAGWRLAAAPKMETLPLLEWHRWLGMAAAATTIVAAVATVRPASGSPRDMWVYRVALFAAAAVMALAGHLGGLLVWGADFLRP
jgi:uncharacterized membrane protein